MPPAISSLRAELRRLTQSIPELAEVFLQRDALLPGSVYTSRRRCGKPNCRCAQGQLHQTEVLSYRGGPRPQNVTPQPGQLKAFKKWTQAYRRFRQARAQLVKLHQQMMRLVDSIEAERVRQGTEKFQALRRSASDSKSKRKR
jgi:hypothetical protein